MGAMRAAPGTEPVLAAEHVVVHYGGARQSARVHAVNGVTLSVAPGEIVGLSTCSRIRTAHCARR